MIAMGIFSTLAACAALAAAPTEQPGPVTESECLTARQQYSAMLGNIELDQADRDAIARVAYAEAANQGETGLAGVVYTIINRLMSEEFGGSVAEVVNARNQFEPVEKAGGQWTALPRVSDVQQARIDTIINLALDGRLPDVTNGARYFQNPAIVQQREDAGAVSEGLTHFGGSAPSAEINDHAFYVEINKDPAQRRVVAANVTQQAQEAPHGQAGQETASWDVFGDLSQRRETDWMISEN